MSSHPWASARPWRHRPFILCYHGVGDLEAPDPHGLFVSPAQFASHLDLIAGRRYELVTVSELWRRIETGEGAAGLGAITFDDGLVKTLDHAMPLLAERGMPSTMYVATGLLGRPHPDAPHEPIASAQQIRELDAQGVEIGSHSVDHPRLTELSYADAVDQLGRSREQLEQLLGHPVTTVAYPFGARSAETISAARAAGYTTACGCSGAGAWRPFDLPREPVFPTDTRMRLTLKLAGMYGPIRGLREALRR